MPGAGGDPAHATAVAAVTTPIAAPAAIAPPLGQAYRAGRAHRTPPPAYPGRTTAPPRTTVRLAAPPRGPTTVVRRTAPPRRRRLLMRTVLLELMLERVVCLRNESRRRIGDDGCRNDQQTCSQLTFARAGWCHESFPCSFPWLRQPGAITSSIAFHRTLVLEGLSDSCLIPCLSSLWLLRGRDYVEARNHAAACNPQIDRTITRNRSTIFECLGQLVTVVMCSLCQLHRARISRLMCDVTRSINPLTSGCASLFPENSIKSFASINGGWY